MDSSVPDKNADAATALVSTKHLRSIAKSVLNLAAGEAVSNFSTFLLFAYMSRHFGIELLGVVALAQTVARYVTLGTDQGTRLVGARLVARNGGAAPLIIKAVLWKRLLCSAICVGIAVLYGLFGPVPSIARPYVVGFALGVIPYAFSLDWLAWGRDKFGWMGVFRGGVTALFLIGSLAGFILAKSTLLPLTVAYGVAAILGAVTAWGVWRLRWKAEVGETPPDAEHLVRKELHWFAVLPLGMATILNQAFHNADTLLLGAMSNAAEVGRYSSAYKILFFVLGAYWLVTTSLYPRLSRLKAGRETERLLRASLLGIAAVGTLGTFLIGAFAHAILTITYGSDLGATRLLRLLAFAIPMDFCVALLTIVFMSRGRDHCVLWGTGTAAVFNIILNLFLIPRFQGLGAAIATLAAYLYLLAFFVQYLIRNPVFSIGSTSLAIEDMEAVS